MSTITPDTSPRSRYAEELLLTIPQMAASKVVRKRKKKYQQNIQ
jgi:hypothetical protein